MNPFAGKQDLPTPLQDILDAVALKLATNQGASQRLFHGRGQTYPGLEFITIDLFAPVLLVTLYREPTANWLDELVERLGQLADGEIFDCIAVQRRDGKNVSLTIAHGELPTRLYAKEDELCYQITLGETQNIGFFLDMQPGRDWLRAQARDKKILNLFAYTCSFSVAALAGGARQVINIDMSRTALATGRSNHLLNFPAQTVADKVIFRDFEILRSIGWLAKRSPFDILVIDPPSYQPGSFIAAKDYPRLIKRMPRLVKPGSLILACLNARNLQPEFLLQSFAQNFPAAKFVQRLTNSADFPDVDAEQSLKLMLFRVAELEHPT
ncbi:MAG: class I SAM-dependent methyltransferase [Pseudomonadales bacterium]